MKRFALLMMAVMFVGTLTLFSCATQDAYRVNTTIESEFAALAEQYELWYQMADDDTKANWKKNVDPLFLEADLLLDVYHDALVAGTDPGDPLRQLNALKTKIMVLLAERMEE